MEEAGFILNSFLIILEERYRKPLVDCITYNDTVTFEMMECQQNVFANCIKILKKKTYLVAGSDSVCSTV